jgi:murein DD-endopeptidase MepM/ murein hydrolase activator NlpD
MQKQHYFIVVLAHSLHGRLQRIHIPYRFLYGVLALAVVAGFSLSGFFATYLRMSWKVANYNSLREEMDTLRNRYQTLLKVANQQNEQLASLQLFASEISAAYGIKRKLEGPDDIIGEGRLVPTMSETIAEYNFLKSASLAPVRSQFLRRFQTQIRPSLWPVTGRLLSYYGRRTDPFTGDGAIHTGVDISAPTGTPVKSAADGVVVHSSYAGAYGKLVVVDHGTDLRTYYAHMSRLYVLPGQDVRKGDVIGLSGATGRVTSPHLHWEVRIGGNPVNPYPYLAKSPVTPPVKPEFPF